MSQTQTITVEDAKAVLAGMIDPENPPTEKQLETVARTVVYNKLDLYDLPFDELSKHTAHSFIGNSIAKNGQPAGGLSITQPVPQPVRSDDVAKGMRKRQLLNQIEQANQTIATAMAELRGLV